MSLAGFMDHGFTALTDEEPWAWLLDGIRRRGGERGRKSWIDDTSSPRLRRDKLPIVDPSSPRLPVAALGFAMVNSRDKFWIFYWEEEEFAGPSLYKSQINNHQFSR